MMSKVIQMGEPHLAGRRLVGERGSDQGEEGVETAVKELGEATWSFCRNSIATTWVIWENRRTAVWDVGSTVWYALMVWS